jgi:hypothetical protein
MERQPMLTRRVGPRARPEPGTQSAIRCLGVTTANYKEQPMAMGNRAMWAILWVIGIPLPILIVLYYLTGGGCAGTSP